MPPISPECTVMTCVKVVKMMKILNIEVLSTNGYQHGIGINIHPSYYDSRWAQASFLLIKKVVKKILPKGISSFHLI